MLSASVPNAAWKNRPSLAPALSRAQAVNCAFSSAVIATSEHSSVYVKPWRTARSTSWRMPRSFRRFRSAL
jgi:hypothetical protein